MFLSFGRQHKGKPVLIVDIESGSVGVAVVEVGGTPAHVLASQRTFLPIETRASEQGTQAILTLLTEVIGQVTKQYTESDAAKQKGVVSSLHVFVGSPWVRSRTAVAEDIFTEDRHIFDAMIKSVAKRALEKDSPLDQTRVFETSVTRVQLNGYATGKPVGKKAHHLRVTVFQSDMDADVKSGVESAVHSFFPGRVINFRSSAHATLATLHERAPTHHYTVIAVGSASTDCIAVHKEDVNEHATVPTGTVSIAQRISGQSGLPEEIFSLMRMLASDTCATPACTALKTNLAVLEPELVKQFGDTFSSMAAYRKIPNVCFLAAHADFVPWLEHFFARIDFSQFTVTAQPLSVEPLTAGYLADKVSWATGVKEDTGIALGAAFVNSVQ